jgi:nucleotide-binding universal stress UspA family protein
VWQGFCCRNIVEYADKTSADFLVVGSRGLGSFKRAALGLIGLGSVSDYVVGHSKTDVVVHKKSAKLEKQSMND